MGKVLNFLHINNYEDKVKFIMKSCILYKYISQQGRHILSSENPGNKIKLKSVLVEYQCPLYKERWPTDLLTIFL